MNMEKTHTQKYCLLSTGDDDSEGFMQKMDLKGKGIIDFLLQ